MPSKKPPPAPPAPRLYLATPPVEDAAALVPVLQELLTAADVAAVLVRLIDGDDRTKINRLKTLAPPIQNAGAALLLDGHSDLVARAGADGVHVSGIEAIKAALDVMKPDRIVGAGGLHSRHDSMVAGEAGADYVLFGEVEPDGHRPSAEAIAERLGWWSELFEPPCVGYADTEDEAEAFAAAGADFILVGDAIWRDARGPQAALAGMVMRIGQGYAARLAKAATKQGDGGR